MLSPEHYVPELTQDEIRNVLVATARNTTLGAVGTHPVDIALAAANAIMSAGETLAVLRDQGHLRWATR